MTIYDRSVREAAASTVTRAIADAVCRDERCALMVTR